MRRSKTAAHASAKQEYTKSTNTNSQTNSRCRNNASKFKNLL